MLVLRDGDAVLLERRPPTGIWGGLWSLPQADGDAALAELARGFGGGGTVPLAPLTHTFTHFRIEIEPRLSDMADGGGLPSGARDADTAWVPLSRLDAYGVPAPVRKLLDALSGPLL